jgi:hypothetical protein
LAACLDDFGEPCRPIIGDFELLARLYTENTSQVNRLIAKEFGDAGVNGIYKESSSSQSLL